MADLKTNYVDDVLDTTKNQLRKYQQIQNDDGTVSFVDVTEYTQVGTSFGARDINDTNAAINDVNGKLTKNNIKKTYNSDTAFNNVINDIASNIADGESANFSFLIDKRDYYFGYLSKYASNIYGGYFVSLGGINYKFTSAIGAVEV